MNVDIVLVAHCGKDYANAIVMIFCLINRSKKFILYEHNEEIMACKDGNTVSHHTMCRDILNCNCECHNTWNDWRGLE